MIADRAPIALVAVVSLATALALAVGAPNAATPRLVHDESAEGRARAARVWAEVDAGFARLDAGIALLDAKITSALDERIGCPSPQDTRAARAKLEELKRQQAQIRLRLAQLRHEEITICRRPQGKVRRVIVDTARIENPLARGCM